MHTHFYASNPPREDDSRFTRMVRSTPVGQPDTELRINFLAATVTAVPLALGHATWAWLALVPFVVHAAVMLAVMRHHAYGPRLIGVHQALLRDLRHLCSTDPTGLDAADVLEGKLTTATLDMEAALWGLKLLVDDNMSAFAYIGPDGRSHVRAPLLVFREAMSLPEQTLPVAEPADWEFPMQRLEIAEQSAVFTRAGADALYDMQFTCSVLRQAISLRLTDPSAELAPLLRY